MKRYIKATQPILAMSMYRDVARRALAKNAETLAEHILKCVVYQNSTDNLKHWVEDEICVYLDIANSITVKPKAKKLKKSDYMETIFSYIGDSERDAKIALQQFKIDNDKTHQYPEFTITPQLILQLFDAYNLIVSQMLPIFTSKNELGPQDLYKLVYTAVKH